MLLVLGILTGLFAGGAHPAAVNLIPSPWDKLVHAVIFALLTWAIGAASGITGWRRLGLAFLGAVLIGLLDEWHQMYLPGRKAGWDDLAADVTGSLIGIALLEAGWRRRN
ncbi:VanZ like family protein [Nitrosospira multiformis]|uniref:VanZ like family protein n=1 Tax=Nitrosospira multiformis TaxID=1231 RepID=A0A1H8MC10_9PROT|nr:VanZ family protein [Nitrosospira multiformis]SEO14824.1 VanZ like family protein [Nitrosospira multiformis]